MKMYWVENHGKGHYGVFGCVVSAPNEQVAIAEAMEYWNEEHGDWTAAPDLRATELKPPKNRVATLVCLSYTA